MRSLPVFNYWVVSRTIENMITTPTLYSSLEIAHIFKSQKVCDFALW